MSDNKIAYVIDKLRASMDDPALAQQVLDMLEDLLVKKGSDYSGKDNTLNAFDRISEVTNLSPEWVMAVLIAKHSNRVISIATAKMGDDGYQPNFDTLFENIKDLLGYMILWLALEKESQDEVRPDNS